MDVVVEVVVAEEEVDVVVVVVTAEEPAVVVVGPPPGGLLFFQKDRMVNEVYGTSHKLRISRYICDIYSMLQEMILSHLCGL